MKTRVNDYWTTRLFYLLTISSVVLFSNGIYLALVEVMESLFDFSIQNVTYQYLFALHLFLGVISLLVLLLYLSRHIGRAWRSNNKKAVNKGKQLSVVLLLVFFSGILLTRGISSFENLDGLPRTVIYVLHVGLPLAGLMIYLNHRRMGNNKKQALLRIMLPVLVLFCVAPLLLHIFPLAINQPAVQRDAVSFFPSLIKTASGTHIEEQHLMNSSYCQQCHQDSHERWQHSAHRFSSFNNPFYKQAVETLRAKSLKASGNVEASRFCAGCHDVVPLLSGNFDKTDFDEAKYVSASEGLTCTVCHAVTSIDSTRGNSDFTIAQPEHYPFAFSESNSLKWLSQLLIKSNPDFHKRTFLKPLHKTSEFCGSCHKVHIPEEVNNYRWLRGQNHYDSFLLSGVSGHSVSSFYYPKNAVQRCSDCHMGATASTEFGARALQGELLSDERYLHDHRFAVANTALNAVLEGNDPGRLQEYRDFLMGVAEVDIIGLREAGEINGKFIGPLKQNVVTLEAGKSYLLEVVIKTRKLGHLFTQGTADSNQVWVDLQMFSKNKLIASSGVLNEASGELDKNTHLINAYLVDKNGNRINKRNAEDIHTVLYDHQIPPGAADVVHYKFTVPAQHGGDLSIQATLKYRKFNAEYYRFALQDQAAINNLPVSVIHQDVVRFSGRLQSEKVVVPVDEWRRINDYGIGLLRKPNKAQYRQAENIFKQVESMGRAEGVLNLARLYYLEGRLDEAAEALGRIEDGALDNPWTASWFAALIDFDNGYLDEAIVLFEKLIATDWQSAKARGFDFSKDYRLLNKYASALLTRMRQEPKHSPAWNRYYAKAIATYQQVLALDVENVAANYGLFQALRLAGENEQAEKYRRLHQKYKPDDIASNNAIGLARQKDDYADKAANAVVIYDLN